MSAGDATPTAPGAVGPGERIVVVGAGMAATRLVEGLVARGLGPRVTVLGDEAHAPYNRILLSAVLEGSHSDRELTLRRPEWFAEHGVDLRLGARVLGVDRERRDVMLVDGTLVGWDRLVLATGAIPTLPPIRGLVTPDGQLAERVHPFRSVADARRLGAALDRIGPHGRAVVVGGGLLGLQVARALAVRGRTVEVVEGGEHLLRAQLGEQAGQVLARELRRLGTDVYTGVRAVRLRGDRLVLDNGHELSTDLVVLTAGGRPSTALARGAGLSVRRGIVVDDRLASPDDPRVHAIGDCAQHNGRVTGFVGPAWEQAEVLAGLLAGGAERYTGSRNVARLRASDLEVAVLGDPEQTDGQVVEVCNPVARTHRKLVVRHGVVVAAALVGDVTHVGLITQHYDRGTVLGAQEPAALLLPPRTTAPTQLHDDTEICSCAGVSAGRIRACSSLEQVVTSTRATTGCGGCSAAVRQLLASRTTTAAATPAAPATADERAPR